MAAVILSDMPVDPDDRSTWPAGLLDALAPWVEAAGSQAHASDLRLPLGNPEVVDLLGGRPVLGYHCTRLMEHEMLSVQVHGLRALSQKRVEDRLNSAVEAGELSSAEAKALESHSVYAMGDSDGRDAQVCAVLGRSVFENEPRGVSHLLANWGGEAIYWHAAATGMTGRLQALGTPSVVVVALQFDAAPFVTFPELAVTFLEHLIDKPARSSDVFYFSNVPAECVVAIEQPGSAGWARLRGETLAPPST